MNKTVTINISGIIFHIGEDAFDVLSTYLAQIKAALSATEGGAEALSDIEARIAELLQAKLGPAKQVILLEDVMQVQEVMGRPEDFGGGAGTASSEEFSGERVKRRLFRNPDEKVLGGVCSGLAAYFDIDTVWVRLAMFLLIFFGGLSLWVYVILWIVIPEARTTADRLAMRGENANLNNIYKTVREEAQDVKNRFSKYGSDLNRNYGERVRSNLSDAVGTVFSILGRIIGFFMLLFGTALLLGYVGALTGISIVDNNHEYSNWRHAIFQSPSDYTLAIIAFILVVGVPVFVLLYLGIKLLFRVRYSNRWLSLGLGMLWLVGVVLAIYVTVDTLRDFSESSRVRQTVVLGGVGDTVVVTMRPGAEVVRAWGFENSGDLQEDLEEGGDYLFGLDKGHVAVIGHARLDVLESTSDSVELIVNYVADGRDKHVANENARAIQYKYDVEGNKLLFDEIFRVGEHGRWRNQKVDLRLKLPVGKVVYFDESVRRFLDDVDNTTNTWDSDMVKRRWKMTSKGLSCIDCENLENVDDFHKNHRHESRVIINGEGIKVDDKDAKVRISNKGISIHTKEEEPEE